VGFLTRERPFPNRNVLAQVLPCAKDTSGKKFFLETKRASGEGKEGIFERTTLRGKRGQLLERAKRAFLSLLVSCARMGH
jgi:hypothetical protein